MKQASGTQHPLFLLLPSTMPLSTAATGTKTLQTQETEKQPVKIYNFGVDYLRLNITAGYSSTQRLVELVGYLNEFFKGFTETSNTKEIELAGETFTADYVHGHHGPVLTLRNSFKYGVDTALIEIKKFECSFEIKLDYQISFYGTGFYVQDFRDYIVHFLELYEFDGFGISRLDLCADINLCVNDLHKQAKHSFLNTIERKKNGDVIGINYGLKGNNKNHFFRVYDKRAEAIKKGRQCFAHYLTDETPVVTRVEVEMRVKTCAVMGVTFRDIIELIEKGPAGYSSSVLWSVYKRLACNSEATDFGIAEAVAEVIDFRKYGKRQQQQTDEQKAIKYFYLAVERVQSAGMDPVVLLNAVCGMENFEHDFFMTALADRYQSELAIAQESKKALQQDAARAFKERYASDNLKEKLWKGVGGDSV